MNGVAICTLCTQNHLHRARILEQSLRSIHPEADFFLLVTDLTNENPQSGAPRTHMLGSDAVLAADELVRLSAVYNALEFSASLKPFLLAHLLNLGYERVLYFDSDIEIFASLDGILAEFQDADILLTPHLLDPIPFDGKLQSELNFLRTGAYNSGFIGVSGGKAANDFLGWWRARLRTHGFEDFSVGLFADQRWLDLAPGLFPNVKILRRVAALDRIMKRPPGASEAIFQAKLGKAHLPERELGGEIRMDRPHPPEVDRQLVAFSRRGEGCDQLAFRHHQHPVETRLGEPDEVRDSGAKIVAAQPGADRLLEAGIGIEGHMALP
jgi:hypothetical protein